MLYNALQSGGKNPPLSATFKQKLCKLGTYKVFVFFSIRKSNISDD